MLTKRNRNLIACLGAALALWLGSCQTTDPPPANTILWLTLNDTLGSWRIRGNDVLILLNVKCQGRGLVAVTGYDMPTIGTFGGNGDGFAIGSAS